MSTSLKYLLKILNNIWHQQLLYFPKRFYQIYRYRRLLRVRLYGNLQLKSCDSCNLLKFLSKQIS